MDQTCQAREEVEEQKDADAAHFPSLLKIAASVHLSVPRIKNKNEFVGNLGGRPRSDVRSQQKGPSSEGRIWRTRR